ncbi:hypothetical protein [Sulfurimonas sp.]|jgi:hypothetical protein|uniref:hypothetical protein n=1 Tax=Sulfurimonas sp. TaxID=2022749 RepID=UPI0025E04906|nr:hypothetical protein [Sulfurimonas sp.]MBT5934270.1 hypothetical protein [Sulfurimonas sp.]
MKILTALCFSLLVFASDTLVFQTQKENFLLKAYAIQLFSSHNATLAKKTLKKVPKELRSKTYLHKIGDYTTIRYARSLSYSKLKPEIEQFYEIGFTDAYIVETESTLSYQKDSQNARTPKSTISEFDRSNILFKAQNAYQKNNESEAIIYYEMLLSSGNTNQKIKNNLCYLYGKRGAWFDAKAIIDKEQYYGKLVYSYAYGAVQSNQEEYYSNLSPYIMIDRSGRLMLLSGYYFENKEDSKRAHSFYKMAYEKNPTDVYNIFAYARALDILQDKKATSLYKNILKKVDNIHPLYTTVYKRVFELGD